MASPTSTKEPEQIQYKLDELSDESEDERRDFHDPERDPFQSEHGPEMGDDGDDNPEYAQPKAPAFTSSGRSVTVKLGNGKTSKVEVIESGQINETIAVRPRANPAGEIVDAGHGFIVNDPRSRPWKTATRTHCANCGGPMPLVDISKDKYLCEFAPESPEFDGCRCSGCTLRRLVLNGHERNRGNPRKVCSTECGRQRDNERNRWKRAVEKAHKAGVTAPDEPEDKGLKLTLRNGPRSGFEGNGGRYTAATDTGLWQEVPRA